VGWPQAAGSFARAQAALRLADGDAGLVAASERAGELLLRADPALAQELARDRLAALDELSPGARARLTATLSAWLAEQGRLGAVAARLEIHPQTARYRLSRLRELFGDRLDDPDERFWLELALRVSSD
jgi:DNA-binding PucR family transcriptional regulator